MSVYSMTGYAAAQSSASISGNQAELGTASNARLGVEIRSVNSRFLDLAFRLPDELRQAEPALRELLVGSLKRGKVELRVSLDSALANTLQLPSADLLDRLQVVSAAIRARLPDAAWLGVAEVLKIAASEERKPHDYGEQLLTLTRAVLLQLLNAREREGGRLALMLKDRVARLRELAALAVPLVPRLVEQQRTRFLERWKEAMALTEGTSLPEIAQDRALTEATAFAIRIDVAEEITRLCSHLDEIDRLLVQGGELGKQLDFLIQELHREANTLGSKSASFDLTRISVEMKVLIEQIREQAQNIE
jgi:uncharacterized protein (TIGR00255 family)